MVFPLFAISFTAYAGGILDSFIQPHIFLFDINVPYERYIIQTYMDEIYKHAFCVHAQSGMHRRFN